MFHIIQKHYGQFFDDDIIWVLLKRESHQIAQTLSLFKAFVESLFSVSDKELFLYMYMHNQHGELAFFINYDRDEDD